MPKPKRHRNLTDQKNIKSTRKPTQRHKDSPLNEQDWVDAALQILVNENIRGIRILALCKKLGVTKGSFYWHFNVRNDLLLAMLKSWRRKMTVNVIKTITHSGNTAYDRLRNLISLPRRPNSPTFAQVEMSIRDWARRNDMPRDAVIDVDHIRMEYYIKLFIDIGYSKGDAKSRAYLTYCMMMGDAVLHKTLSNITHEEFLDDVMKIIIKK